MAVKSVMKVIVESLYTEQVWHFEGTPRQIEAQLLMKFPWMRSPDPRWRGDLEALLEDLGSQQAFLVQVTEDKP